MQTWTLDWTKRCFIHTHTHTHTHTYTHIHPSGPKRTSQVVLVVKNPPANAGDIRDSGSISGSGRSPGRGSGHPLQYSCLESPMDRGVWQTTVHKVAKSQTWLKRLSTYPAQSLGTHSSQGAFFTLKQGCGRVLELILKVVDWRKVRKLGAGVTLKGFGSVVIALYVVLQYFNTWFDFTVVFKNQFWA